MEDEGNRRNESSGNPDAEPANRVLYGGDFFSNLSIGITRLLVRFELTRFEQFKLENFVPAARDYMVFIRAAKYTFTRHFHATREVYFDENFAINDETRDEEKQKTRRRSRTTGWKDVNELSFIGKTSYTMHGTIEHDQREPKQFVDFLVKFVRIDPETRRPMPLDDAVRAQQAAIAGSGIDIERPGPVLNENKRKLVGEFTVQTNHIDSNNHTNYCAYVLFSERTAVKAVAENVYPSVRGELKVDDVESLTVYFERECSLGDTVHVHTWEGAPRQLQFQAFKGDTLLSSIIMTLYSTTPHSVL